MKPLVTSNTPPTDEVLNTIAHLPTKGLSKIVEDGFFQKPIDKDFTRIAVLLALKSYEEGGCPIGGVFINNETRIIPGEGHNTLAQENHPYNLGETSAARDPGRQDLSRTTMFTSLSPCDTCAALVYRRQFQRLVVGEITNFAGNEEMLRQKGVRVEIMEDPFGMALFAKYFRENPDQHVEDARCVAEVRKGDSSRI